MNIAKRLFSYKLASTSSNPRRCCWYKLSFWDEAWRFLSLRVFGQLSSSLFLFPQRFGRYVLRPSSGVCWNQEPSRNFELQATPVDSIKDEVRSFEKVPEFNKHLKKAGGHIGWNVVEITIKMNITVRRPLIIKKGCCWCFTLYSCMNNPHLEQWVNIMEGFELYLW